MGKRGHVLILDLYTQIFNFIRLKVKTWPLCRSKNPLSVFMTIFLEMVVKIYTRMPKAGLFQTVRYLLSPFLHAPVLLRQTKNIKLEAPGPFCYKTLGGRYFTGLRGQHETSATGSIIARPCYAIVRRRSGSRL